MSGAPAQITRNDTAVVAPTRAVAARPALAARTTARRLRLIDRRFAGLAARGLDTLAVAALAWGLCLGQGLDLLQAPFLLSLAHMAIPAGALGMVAFVRGYRLRYAEPVMRQLDRVAAAAIAGATLGLGFAWLVTGGANAPFLAGLAGASVVAIAALHVHHIALLRVLARRGWMADRVVIVGATPAAARMVAANARERELDIVGFFDDRLDRAPASMGDTPFLGAVDDLLAWPDLPEVDRIVVTVPSTARQRVKTLVDRLRALPQEVILVLDLEDFSPETTSLAHIADAPAAWVSGAPRDLRRAAMKRAFDLVIGSLMLAVFLIPMLVIAIAVKLDSRGPVLFRQKRHGFNNEIIRVWKFRTMRPDRKAEEGMIEQTRHNDERVTRIGRFLRATSLDELPQLMNVLSGEMSLVGPRPHAVGMTAEAVEVHRIVADYAHRHRMKPGLTGWAQVNGSRGPVHTAEGVRERLRLDMEYVQKGGFWMDLYIVVMTVPRLFGDWRKDR